MSEKELKILNRLGEIIQTDGVSNEFLVQLTVLGFNYLNLLTIPQYCSKHKKTYRGVKENRKLVELAGKNFIIDNV